MVASFFTAYGNNVVLNESDIKIDKKPSKIIEKVEYQKQSLYGSDRTIKRKLSSNLKVKNKLNKQVSVKSDNKQASPAQLSHSVKPEEGTIIKERDVSRIKLNVGPRRSISENQISRNSRTHETLFFSEYAEGSSYNKYLEIYNPTNETIDLSGYAYPNTTNGADVDGVHDYWNTFADGASIAPGAVYIIAHPQADASILALANEEFTYLSSGDDGFCLAMGSEADYELVDCVGDFGGDPGTAWDVAGTSNGTKEHTLVRKTSVSSGNGGDWTTSAGTNVEDSEWIVYAQNTWTYLGYHNTGIVFSGTFDGSQYDGATNTYTMPTAAEDWAGFANQDGSIYPLSFPDGGSISFYGSTAGTDVDVYFRLEANPYPNTEPSVNTGSVTVSGTDAMHYMVDIPPQGENTFNSFLLYVETRDAPVTINAVSLNLNEFDGTYLSEGFEGGVFPPTGWDMVSFDEYGYQSTAGWLVGDGSSYGPGLPNSGDFAAYYDVWNYWYGSNSMLITPSIDLSGATAPKLSFYFWDSFHSSSYGYALEVSISTDAGVSFGTPVYTSLGTVGWEKIDIDLSSYVGQTIHVAFKSTSDYGSNNPHLDDISIAEPPSYPIADVSTEFIDFGVIKASDTKTETFSVNNIGGAVLSWTALSDGSLFTISSSSGTIDPGAMADITVTYAPTSASVGVVDSAYIIITHDAESSPDSVFLIGSAHNDLYRTSFEEPWSEATDARPSSPPGWSHIKVSGEGGWGQLLTSSASDGDYVARAYYNFANGTDSDGDGVADNPGEHLLISPALDLSSGETGFKLTFDALSSSYPETRLEVQISSQNTDALSGWTTLGSYVYGDNLTFSMSEQSIGLGDYSDGTYYIGFRMFDENGYYIYVDDIKVEPLPATAELSVAVTDLAFPATPIGSSVSETITITNSGAATLTGTITYPDGFTGPADFSTDGSADITISYSPTTAGLHIGSVVITSNGGDASIVVTGAAGGSVATWDIDYDNDGYEDWPLGWDWVNNDGGSQEWDFWDYARTGTGSAGVRYEGPFANDDWLISPQLDVVAGDKFVFFARGLSSFYTESFNVMLSTTGANDVASFDVTLLSDAATSTDYVSYEIDLSAYVGTQPRVAIQYNATDQYYLFVDDIATSSIYVPAGPALTDYYSSVDYGNVLAGATSSFTWDYVNGGAADLEVTAVEFSNAAFSLSSDVSLPVVTVPSAIGGFDVVFSPPADVDASYAGTMTVTHNGGDDIVVNVSGYGLFATFIENFDNLDEGTNLPSGWTSIDDTDENSWVITASGGTSNFLFHSDGSSGIATQYDTVVTSAISLPTIADYHYELEFSDYVNYGSYATYSGIHISQDGGLTWTEIYESDYANGWDTGLVLDLTGYDGGDIHFAFVYVGGYDHEYGVDDLIIRSKPDPVVPILQATSSIVFPPTAMGTSSVEWLYFINTGSGNYEGSITYPDGVAGSASISGLQPGILDSMEVTYTPTAQGVFTGEIVFDGTASGAASFTTKVEGNAGAQVATFEDSWIGWDDYSLLGQTSNSGTPDTWLWFGGQGHAGPNFAGVYSHDDVGYWGGVNDFLVSPKLEVVSGDVFSFWSRGGYTADCALGENLGINTDSVAVWVSIEKPVMGMNSEGVDTGFVNTSAFTLLGEGKPSCDNWDAFSFDLSSYAGDAWLLIQSAKAGWWLNVDDVAYPEMYMNSNPVLYVGKEYDFGVTQPTGDSVTYIIRNTGLADLVIESMAFENGEYFSVDPYFDLPLTLQTNDADTFTVYWEPEGYGVERDTLVYVSNYTVGDVDAFGRGTDHTVFTASASNVAPYPTTLITPSDGTELTIDGSNSDGTTSIFWMSANDPDGTPIEYILEFAVTNLNDTLDTVVTSTNFNLSHQDMLDVMTESGVTHLDIMWNVYTFDGFDGTGSTNGPWSLTIDGGWALSLDNNTLPEVFALHNNYPNPFNPITNIRYDVPELSDVKIDIYNIAGKKIKTLVSSEHQPGRYKIQWNATNEQGAPVATGMYIYKIRANDFVSVKKLLLMK